MQKYWYSFYLYNCTLSSMLFHKGKEFHIIYKN
mgnify:FL=1